MVNFNFERFNFTLFSNWSEDLGSLELAQVDPGQLCLETCRTL